MTILRVNSRLLLVLGVRVGPPGAKEASSAPGRPVGKGAWAPAAKRAADPPVPGEVFSNGRNRHRRQRQVGARFSRSCFLKVCVTLRVCVSVCVCLCVCVFSVCLCVWS